MARAGGPAARALSLIDQNAVSLYVSRQILQELRRILQYPELRLSNPQLTDVVIETFFRHLLFRGILIREVPHVFDLPRDPGDEPYIDLAAAVEADFLTSRDADLLSLMTDHGAVAQEFRRRFHWMRVVGPPELLAEIERIRQVRN
jgi:putative PIN family toxin of toxin-antitoxin system